MAVAGPITQPTAQKDCVNFVNDETIANSSEARQRLETYVNHAETNIQTIQLSMQKILTVAQLIELSGDYFSQQNITSIVITTLNFTISDPQGLLGQQTAYTCHSNVKAIAAECIALPAKINSTINRGLQLATVVNAKGETTSGQPFYHDELGRVCIKFIWEDYPDNAIDSNQFDQCVVNSLHHWDNGIYRIGSTVVVDFINRDPDRPIIIGALNHAEQLLLGKYNSDNETQSILQRIPGADTNAYNQIIFDDQEETPCLTITAIDAFNTSAKKESFVSEECSHQIEKSYQLQADSEEYQSNQLKRTVKGQYELTADSINIKGEMTLKGNFTLDGNLTVTGKVDIG